MATIQPIVTKHVNNLPIIGAEESSTQINENPTKNPDFKPNHHLPQEYSIDNLIQELQNPTLSQKDQGDQKFSIKNFIDEKLVFFTTVSSVLFNFISAPIRLFDDENPLKKIINNVSMAFTKSHLLSYGCAGMMTAWEQKNPFLLFSFFTEGLSSVFDLRSIYLFRGIATGIDGAVAAVKERYENENPGKEYKFKTIKESFDYTWGKLKEITQEVIDNPAILKKLGGEHTLVSSSFLMILGSIFGLTVNDKIGGSTRDFFGGFNDFGLTQLENPTGRKAGFFYLMGTAKDFLARFFSESSAKFFGIEEVDKFKKFRDFFHELALGFDRIGQYFFLRYNQPKVSDQDPKEIKNSINKKISRPELMLPLHSAAS
jgi:hypothetical protein